MEAQRLHGSGGYGTLGSARVDDDTDDLDIIRRVEIFEHNFGVSHLRHSFFRDEAYGIDVLKAAFHQGAKILRLYLRRYDLRQSLPRIPRTLN
jgi:hypothetical protein